jgi:hypothetical protein
MLLPFSSHVYGLYTASTSFRQIIVCKYGISWPLNILEKKKIKATPARYIQCRIGLLLGRSTAERG